MKGVKVFERKIKNPYKSAPYKHFFLSLQFFSHHSIFFTKQFFSFSNHKKKEEYNLRLHSSSDKEMADLMGSR